ncbi:hypothetical protein BTVI_33936 [Pitangus sulphuratus]|nr:hypothetical protein BTVI_33936 [Pitangus sulphuratus]
MPAVESEAKAKTKVRFEEIFRRHAGLTDAKKSKKKKFKSPESIVLDTFRNKIDLSKESVNDEAIINNTYNPEEESPRFTKNKLREKASIAEKINNDIVSGEEKKQPKSNRKKKKSLLQEQFNEEENLYEAKLGSFEKKTNDFPKKKTKSKSQTDVLPQDGDRKIKNSLTEVRNVTELEEEEQLIQAYQLHVAEDEANAIKKKMRKKLKEQMSESTSVVQSREVALNNELGKKKKKKKEIAVLNEAETSAMSISELQHHPEDGNESQSLERLFTSEGQTLKESMDKQKPKARKVKKKTRKEETTEVATENDEEMKNSEISTQSKFGFSDDLILGVYIHRCDRLKTDLLVSHPVVKIHVVDQRSGLYVKKDHSKREVSSYEQEEIEHILPIMTQPYDFRQSKSTVPEWEEQVIFNERFTYFTQNTEENPQVILFFEVLDSLSMDEVRTRSDVQIQEGRFRKICWAFLKLVGANGVLNIGGKLRLQLYYPPSRTKSHSNVVEVYDWWAKCPRNRYPSTLYVTVKGIKLPDHKEIIYCEDDETLEQVAQRNWRWAIPEGIQGQEIKENDIKGIPINHLEVHPNGRRLLIHAKDSTLRIIDLRILATKKYIGATNYREKIHSTLTPCGTFLFSGSEDGKAYVWNPETGDQVAIYSELSFTSSLRDVAFHPHEHMVSFCAFGQNQPILVYIYDYKGELKSLASCAIISVTTLQAKAARHSQRSTESSLFSHYRKWDGDSRLTFPGSHSNALTTLSFHEEILPNVQSEPLMVQLESMSSCCVTSCLGEETDPHLATTSFQNDDTLIPLGVGGGSSCPLRQETVVALYDYTAHRSDELTIHRSDIIQVLYKDNDNWWFGSLANGQQGYFPANYVAGEKECEEQPSELVSDSAPLLPEEPTEAEEGSLTLDKMSPVISKSGDLKFVSKCGTDRDSPATQGTKKKKKRIQGNERENQHNLMSLDTPLSSVTANGVENEPTSHGVELKKKKKKAVRGSNLSTNGKTNIAFEPECRDV